MYLVNTLICLHIVLHNLNHMLGLKHFFWIHIRYNFWFLINAAHLLKCTFVFIFCIEPWKRNDLILVPHLQDSCKALEPPTVQKWQHPAYSNLHGSRTKHPWETHIYEGKSVLNNTYTICMNSILSWCSLFIQQKYSGTHFSKFYWEKIRNLLKKKILKVCRKLYAD